MRSLHLLALIASISACAHTAVHRRYVDRYESPTIVGRAQDLTLDAHVADGRLHVIAQRPRRCYREVHETDEAMRQKEGDTGVFEGQGGGDAVLGAALALVTAAQLISDHPTVKLEDHVVDRVDESCPLPEARLPVVIELPSGGTLDVATDLAGMLDVELPRDEHGTLTVRAADAVAIAAF